MIVLVILIKNECSVRLLVTGYDFCLLLFFVTVFNLNSIYFHKIVTLRAIEMADQVAKLLFFLLLFFRRKLTEVGESLDF